MRAPLKVRLLAIPLVILPLLAGLVLYVATRDWEHLRGQYELGHKPTLPPRTTEGPKPEAIDAAQQTLASVFEIACLIAMCALLLMLAIVARRMLQRRRRTAVMDRWVLHLGRDDLANPYRVQEMFGSPVVLGVTLAP